jgi:hypothetical protein
MNMDSVSEYLVEIQEKASGGADEVKWILENADRARKGELMPGEVERYRENHRKATNFAFSNYTEVGYALGGYLLGEDLGLYEKGAADSFRGIEGWRQPMSTDEGTLAFLGAAFAGYAAGIGGAYLVLNKAQEVISRSEEKQEK